MSLFYNRKEELELLEEQYASKNSSLVIIYGRRRVGKTELVLNFIKNKSAVYSLSQKFSEARQVTDFLENACIQLDIYVPKISTWVEALKFISENLSKKGKPIIVIDEVPYLIDGNNAVMSSFQKAWDEYLKDKNIMLILLGSSITMMENEVLAYKSPLYGRRTSSLCLDSMKFKDLKSFFPKKNNIELMQIYGCLGGVPAYLNKFNKTQTLIENIEKTIFKRSTFLYDEVHFLLKEELREPMNYELILESISNGNCRLSKIANHTGIPIQNISKYLRILISLGIVKKEYPLCLKKRKEIKTGSIYTISDNFFNFWYSYVYPVKSQLDINKKSSLTKIKNTYDAYLGHIFEIVCIQFMSDLVKSEKAPIKIEKMGRQWGKIKNAPKGKNTYEIDIIALNDETKDIMFIECKWKTLTQKQAETIINDLKEKSKHVDWNNQERNNHFAIIAKKINNKQQLKQNGILAYDLADFLSND